MNTKQTLLLVSTMCILTFGATAMAQPLLDCSEASVIACGEEQTNQTPPGEPGAGNVTNYCTDLIFTFEDAWEFVYELTLDSDQSVFIVMTYDHVPGVNDLDIGLLGSCDEIDCIEGSFGQTGIEEINVDLPAGTYYIVVDGYQGQQDGSPHTMTIICEPVAIEATTWSAVKGLYR